MALAQRIESLKKRHTEIDLRLLAETARPAPDDILLHDLKRQKLSLKDEMLRLMSGHQEERAA